MQTEVIDSKKALVLLRGQILSLFSECYGKELPGALWDWAYIDNVFGNPVVTVCIDGGKVVAHYAVVPFFLHNGQGDELRSYLSMTTMVAPSHRNGGLFVKLADITYERMVANGGTAVVGFPNTQSSPGFKKYLGWTLDEMDYVALVGRSELLADEALKQQLDDRSRFALNMGEATIRKWRMARPGGTYHDMGGCVVKSFGDNYDLMWAQDSSALASLPGGRRFNLLVEAANPAHLAHKQFDYQFGYRHFNGASGLAVCKTLSLSDVF